MKFDWSRFARDVELSVYGDFASVAAAAQALGVAQNTLRKIMKGDPVNAGVRVRVSTRLGLEESVYLSAEPERRSARRPVEPAVPDTPIKADALVGSHPLQTYFGRYRLLRRLYGATRAVVESRIDVFAQDATGALLFTERKAYRGRDGRAGVVLIEGEVHVSALLSTMHFLSIAQGGVRLATIWKPGSPQMLGVVLSQTPNRNFYSPAVSPILLERLGEEATPAPERPIQANSAEFERVDALLTKAETQFFFQSSPAGMDESFAVPD